MPIKSFSLFFLTALHLGIQSLAGDYIELAGSRCQEMAGEHPLGGVGDVWHDHFAVAAMLLCDGEVLCTGFMRYVGNHEAHCREWCGRPQFCVANESGLVGRLDPNPLWRSFVKASALQVHSDYHPSAWLTATGPSGDLAAPLRKGELLRWVECASARPVALVSEMLLQADLGDACRVLVKPFSSTHHNVTGVDGILSEAEERDLPMFSASQTHPWRFHFDPVPEYPSNMLSIPAKHHTMSIYFLSVDSRCPYTDTDSVGPGDVDDFADVYVEDGTHETRKAAFQDYHFTILCGDFEAQPFPHQAVVYAIAFGSSLLVPEYIHWHGSRLHYHLPDAAQGYRTISLPHLEAYFENLLDSPDHELWEFKYTFMLLNQQILMYRYREHARKRAEVAACALCDARSKAARREAVLATLNAHPPGDTYSQGAIGNDSLYDHAVEVVFCVMSRRSAHELRNTVRGTWGQSVARFAPAVVQRFFVGQQPSSSIMDIAVGDVVELSVVESYRTLNVKTISMLRWTHERFPNLQWVVRHDDDVYLRAPALLAQLAARPPVRYFWGNFDHGSTPQRSSDHQHYNTFQQYPDQRHPVWGDIFPPYARGLLWAMSVDLMGAVLEQFSREIRDRGVELEVAAEVLPHPDDPAIGVAIAALVSGGMSVNLDDRDFNSFSLNPACNSTYSNINNKTWVVHHVKPDTMVCMWKLDAAADSANVTADNSAIDASHRIFPDLCLCSEDVEEEEEFLEPGGRRFWYDRQRGNFAR